MAAEQRDTTDVPMRFIRRPVVMYLTGLGRTAIDDQEAAGHFPRRFPIGPRAVAWLESEVNAWQRARIERARV